MRRVRVNSDRQVAAVAVDVTAVADTAGAGTVASEEAAAATNQLAVQRTLQPTWENMGRAGFEPAKA